MSTEFGPCLDAGQIGLDRGYVNSEISQRGPQTLNLTHPTESLVDVFTSV